MRRGALSLAMAVAVWAAAPSALAAKDGLAPDVAAARRAQVEANLDADVHRAVAQLRDVAEQQGDPELFLYAALMAVNEAEQSRDQELAELAAELAYIGYDIGLHLADERNYAATNWRPVTRERALELAGQAGPLIGRAQVLAREIADERAAAEAERLRAAEAQPKRERRPGSGLIIGGSVALGLGLGGAGMMVAGMVLGAANQREAESLVLPLELWRLEEIDRAGALDNKLAIVGGAVAGVGIIAGATLIALGNKKRKAAGPGPEAQLRVGPWLGRGLGLSVGGSF